MLELLALIAEIFSKAGGPEKLKEWTAKQLPEMRQIRDSLTGPNQPFPKG